MIRLTSFLILFIAVSYADEKFYAKVRNFSTELIYFTQIRTNGNVVLAPFGIWSLLSQVAYETQYETKNQMFKTLILNTDNILYSNKLRDLTAILKEKSDGVTLINDNFVLVDTYMNLSSNFVNRMRYYQANIIRLDFRESTSARLSNILTKANKQIPQIFNEKDFIDSEMIIGNQFIFKGKWSIPFNRSNTVKFQTYDQDNSVMVIYDMMKQDMQIPQSGFQLLEAIVTELAFGVDGKYSMLIIKPYDGVTIKKVYKHLAQIPIPNVFDKLNSDVKDGGLKNITFGLPRVEIQSFLVLNAPLNDMGIYDAFSSDSANFIKLSSDDLYIDAVEQRTKISMTEEGIEAFSTIPANLEVSIKSSPMGPQFIFFIVNKATMTIVLGGVNGRS